MNTYVNPNNVGSPILLDNYDEPINILRMKSGFWISQNMELKKDEKRNYIVISVNQAVAGREKYLEKYKQQIYTQKIESELFKLQSDVDRKLTNLLDKLQTILILSGKKEVKISFAQQIILDNLRINYKYDFERMQKESGKIVTAEFLNQYNYLTTQKQLGNQKDYDTLYNFLSDNRNTLGFFQLDNESHVKALLSNFHASEILKTIECIQEKGTLYTIAKINVDKRSR
jgi:hypothetical protein